LPSASKESGQLDGLGDDAYGRAKALVLGMPSPTKAPAASADGPQSPTEAKAAKAAAEKAAKDALLAQVCRYLTFITVK
jgi:hypothetical protein